MNSHLQRIHEIEEELKIRFGKPKRASAAAGSWEFRSLTGSARAMMRRLGRRSHAASGGAEPHQQRVVVKASYRDHRGKGAGLLRAHVNYLSRDSASLDGKEGHFYDAQHDEVDAKQLLRDWEQDPRHFRWIISPENAAHLENEPGGLKGYIRQIMSQAERKLGAKLQWIAINHYNTDDLHAHVLIRGAAENGTELRLPRTFVSHEIRQSAQEIATRWLGPRSNEQVQAARKQELTAERYTPLDAVIQKHTGNDHRVQLPSQAGDLRQRAAARLQHLQQLGLAQRDRWGRWQIDQQLEDKLRDLSERNDIIKNLYPKLGIRSGQVSRGLPNSQPLIGHVVTSGVHDELRDQMYLLVRDQTDSLRYVRVVNGQNLSVLEEDSVVRLSTSDPRRLMIDQRIARIAEANRGTYSAAAHRQSLPARFDASDIDSFLASHQRRLATLEQTGAATRTGEGWTLANSEGLARGDYARFGRGLAFVEILSARSVQSQVQAEAWTWLDRQLLLQTNQKQPAIEIDRTLHAAAEARRQWLAERGSTTAAALGQREWQAAKPAMKQRFGGAALEILPAGSQIEGQYRSMVSLHAGLYAAISKSNKVHLAPVTQAPPLAYGTAVRAKVSSLGTAVLTRLGPQRQQEQGLERD